MENVLTIPKAVPSLSIIIPVYNEDKNIEKTLEALRENVPVPYETLIVYDRDEDTTIPVARRLMQIHPESKLLKNHIARGPSGAIRTGIQAARASRILVAMADLCDDFSQIPQMLDWVPSRADMVCPSRYCEGGAQMLEPSLKVWAPKMAGRLLHGLTGLPTLDPTNSFKLYSAEMVQNLNLTSTTSFSVTLEMVAKAHCLGCRIVEIPTVWRDRQHGKTNFKLFQSLIAYFPWLCLALSRNRLLRLPISISRRRSPVNV